MVHEHERGHERREELRGASRRRLAVVLVLTVTFLVIEVIGAVFSNSLALLADASHMLSDTAAVGLALVALRYASRPATPERTYGFARAEILAALLNALTLILIVGFVFWQAWLRVWDPPEVHSVPMLVVATGGLLVNLVNAWILSSGRRESLNVEGAYLHVLGDTLGSVGAIVAGVVIVLTGAYVVDALVSVLIGVIILWSAWDLLRRAIAVLMEGTPPGIDLVQVRESMLGVDGVTAVHDLHVWTLTSGFVAMSAHVIAQEGQSGRVLNQLRDRLHDDFGISHTTLQIETTPAAEESEESIECVVDPRCLTPDGTAEPRYVPARER